MLGALGPPAQATPPSAGTGTGITVLTVLDVERRFKHFDYFYS